MTEDAKLLGRLEAVVERIEEAGKELALSVGRLEKRVTALEHSRAFVHGVVAAISAVVSAFVTWLSVKPHL